MLIDYMENADTLKYFDGSHDHRIVLKHQNEIIAKAVNNGDQVSISDIKATDDDDNTLGSKKSLSMKPSDYFRRQCFIACDPDEGTLSLVAEYMDGESIIFNTDYPHPDAAFPGAVDDFLEQSITESHKEKILWDNSVRLYGEKVLTQ